MHDVVFVQKQFHKQRLIYDFVNKMSSSEQSSSSESDNDSIPDIHKLQPYDLEPEIASSDVSTIARKSHCYFLTSTFSLFIGYLYLLFA